jgi:hypothetical protein
MVIQWVYRNWKNVLWFIIICPIALAWIWSIDRIIDEIIKAYPIPHVSGLYYNGFFRPFFTLSILFIFVSLMSKLADKRSLSGYGLNKKIDKKSLVLAILLGLFFGGWSILADFIQREFSCDKLRPFHNHCKFISRYQRRNSFQGLLEY